MSPRRKLTHVRHVTLPEVLDEVRRIVAAAKSGKSTGGIDLSINWQDGHLTWREISRRDHAAMRDQEMLDTRTV
jgi:hypothetical protein